MAARVVVLLIPDEAFAWEVLHAASEEGGAVERAVMVDPDSPHTVSALVSERT